MKFYSIAAAIALSSAATAAAKVSGEDRDAIISKARGSLRRLTKTDTAAMDTIDALLTLLSDTAALSPARHSASAASTKSGKTGGGSSKSGKGSGSCYKKLIGQGKYASQGIGNRYDTTISCISCADLPDGDHEEGPSCDEQSGGTGIRCQYSETGLQFPSSVETECNYLGYFGIDKVQELDGKCSFGYGDNVKSVSDVHKITDDDAMVTLFSIGNATATGCDNTDSSFRIKGYYDYNQDSTVLYFSDDEGETIYNAKDPRLSAAY